MKKISLAILLFFAQLLQAFGQDDTAAYKPRKLKLDEVNFVSGYYSQDGNNSAVTGGIGTEQLTDFANTIELHFVRTDKQQRLHNINFELGIDHYSSASSDQIDPSTISSASSADTRYYPSLGYSIKDEKKGYSAGIIGSFSKEYDYTSLGLGLNFSKNSKDNNREFAVKLQAYFDTWSVILPIELRKNSGKEEHSEARNSYSASLSFAQVINQRLQLALLADLIYQKGLLATRYQRVYFADGSLRAEELPDTRFKLPLGFRLHYFLGDRYILRTFYRFYWDDWKIGAHTADIELPIKLNPFISFSPFYRYYTQTAADYFAPFKTHHTQETYFTSDYDLSAFNSHFFGAGIRWAPEKGVFGIKKWAVAELRYGHYIRSTELTADIISLSAKFK